MSNTIHVCTAILPHERPAPNLLHGLLEIAHHVIIVGRNKHELHFVLLDGFLELQKKLIIYNLQGAA